MNTTLLFGYFTELLPSFHTHFCFPVFSTNLIKLNSITFINIFCSKNLEVKFAVSLGVSSLPEDIAGMEEQVKFKHWEKARLLEDMKRQEDLLNQVEELYSKQKQELMDYLTHPTVTQVQHQYQFITL
jgi:hypothetical protein